MLWCLKTTDRKCRPFLLFNQTTGLNIPINRLHGYDRALGLTGKSLFSILFIRVLLILLGPFTSHATQRDVPDYPSPQSSHSSLRWLQRFSIGHNSTPLTYSLMDHTNCFMSLVSLTR